MKQRNLGLLALGAIAGSIGLIVALAGKAKAAPQVYLAVYVYPDGAGYVTKFPDKPSYSPGDVITLAAYPNAGYHFHWWTKEMPDGTEIAVTDELSYTFTITENTTMWAEFLVD